MGAEEGGGVWIENDSSPMRLGKRPCEVEGEKCVSE